MAYISYADSDYYHNVYNGDTIPEEERKKRLLKSSRHIDALTYNRIAGKGIDVLTEFQKGIVQDACCQLADFEYENEELINTILKSYSLNGVSLSLDNSWNMLLTGGVAIRRDIYSMLEQTGLCYKGVR